MQSRIICVHFVFESVVGSLPVLGRNKNQRRPKHERPNFAILAKEIHL